MFLHVWKPAVVTKDDRLILKSDDKVNVEILGSLLFCYAICDAKNSIDLVRLKTKEVFSFWNLQIELKPKNLIIVMNISSCLLRCRIHLQFQHT